MAGYESVDPGWRATNWDPGNAYSVPWQWGTTSFTLDTDPSGDDIDMFAVLVRPASELQGRIGMFRAPDEVIAMAQLFLGVPL